MQMGSDNFLSRKSCGPRFGFLVCIKHDHQSAPPVGIWSYPFRTPLIPDRLKTSLELAFSPRWREDGANGASKTRRRPPRPLPPTHTRSERGTRVPCPGTHVADVVDLDREGRNRPCTPAASLYLSSALRACLTPPVTFHTRCACCCHSWCCPRPPATAARRARPAAAA